MYIYIYIYLRDILHSCLNITNLDPNAKRLKVLFLGEGNFSFCRSLIQQNVKHDVYATCFESEESANESTMENIAILKTPIT